MPDVSENDGLTVGDVSARLGVSVRALHHWDEIGLARSSLRSAAGYRLYTSEDLQRLHRIIVYRETGLGLEKIRSLLDDSGTDVPTALRAQQADVEERIERLKQLSSGLDRMITAQERGVVLTVEQQAAIFGPSWDPEAAARARQYYGDTAEWRQFAERSASRSVEDWQAITDAVKDFERDLARTMDAGHVPGSAAANDLVERHRHEFSESYFPLTRQMQVCLGRVFEQDPGYSAYYEGIRDGLSSWFRQSIEANARAHGIDPDTAIWQ